MPPHFQSSMTAASPLTLAATDMTATKSIPGNTFLPAHGAMRSAGAMTPDQRMMGHNSMLRHAASSSRLRAPLRSDCAVGREIRELRRAKMMTQKDLAAMVGVTGAQLHRYETGATRIAASRLIAIADALEVRPDRLLAAASESTASHHPATPHGGDDILDLIQIFSAISDAKCRAAIMTVVRMLATQHLSQSPEAAVA